MAAWLYESQGVRSMKPPVSSRAWELGIDRGEAESRKGLWILAHYLLPSHSRNNSTVSLFQYGTQVPSLPIQPLSTFALEGLGAVGPAVALSRPCPIYVRTRTTQGLRGCLHVRAGIARCASLRDCRDYAPLSTQPFPPPDYPVPPFDYYVFGVVPQALNGPVEGVFLDPAFAGIAWGRLVEC